MRRESDRGCAFSVVFSKTRGLVGFLKDLWLQAPCASGPTTPMSPVISKNNSADMALTRDVKPGYASS